MSSSSTSVNATIENCATLMAKRNKIYLDNQKLNNWRLKDLALSLGYDPWTCPWMSLSRFDWPSKFVAQRDRRKLRDFYSQTKWNLPRQSEIEQLKVEGPCLISWKRPLDVPLDVFFKVRFAFKVCRPTYSTLIFDSDDKAWQTCNK
mgnify:CR=1 FL=1